MNQNPGSGHQGSETGDRGSGFGVLGPGREAGTGDRGSNIGHRGSGRGIWVIAAEFRLLRLALATQAILLDVVGI